MLRESQKDVQDETDELEEQGAKGPPKGPRKQQRFPPGVIARKRGNPVR